MNYTFNLKDPKSKNETLIYFSSYFKKEDRKFVYSTGEKIRPSEWDFKNRMPNNLTGKNQQANQHRTIKKQLDRYSGLFIEIVNRYKNTNQDLDIDTVKNEFNSYFKKLMPKSNDFFYVYDLFINNKKNNKSDTANSETTIKRYEYNRKLLDDYQMFCKSNINFFKINEEFYNDFLDFCITVKKHSANTLRRNVGLFKTFLNWSIVNGYTYNNTFLKFATPKAYKTDELALSLEQVKEIFEYDFKEKERLEKVRDLFIFGCATGLRISNYSKVNKNDIENDFIKVYDRKDRNKMLKIPLNIFSKTILEKYNYNIPTISTQKFNEYIKDVFLEVGLKHSVKKMTKVGNEIIEENMPFNERISSHTARRSFITIMKNERVPDKVIMDITGHKSLEVFNRYYKPNDNDKKEFMNNVWKF